MVGEIMDVLEWVVRDTYEFEQITCASRLSFPNSLVFHARSFYEEKIVTSYSPPTFIPQCAPPKCDFFYAFDHNYKSCP